MKKNSKKGEDEDLEEYLDQLKIDIDILEHDIHLEEIKEFKAIEEYQKVIENTYSEESSINSGQEETNHVITTKMLNLNNEEKNKKNSILEIENEILKIEKTILVLKKESEVKDVEFQKQENERKLTIDKQKKFFKDMAIKFKNILISANNHSEEEINIAENAIKLGE